MVFVPGGMPGDRVLVRLQSRQSSYARAELVQILNPGPQRVDPACRLSMPQPGQAVAACGGCPLMALSLPAQRAAKQSWVERALRGLSVLILPMAAPASSVGYRVRARMAVRSGRLSFAAAGSHQGVALSACPVLAPKLEQVLLRSGTELAAALGEGGVLSGLQGWHAGQPAVHLAAEPGHPSQRSAARRLLLQMIDRADIVGASLHAHRADDRDEVLGVPVIDLADPSDESTRSLGSLFGSAAGFAQACAAGHTLLPALVADAVQRPFCDGTSPLLPQPHILELFSGSGNLTRALQPLAQALTCIEGDRDAVARAVARFGDSISLRAEPVEAALAQLATQGARFSTIVLDPPRAGARDAMVLLSRLGAQRVVYVSCDVMTLARDMSALRSCGYRPRVVQPIDLMPHTAQVECVAICDRDPASA